MKTKTNKKQKQLEQHNSSGMSNKVEQKYDATITAAETNAFTAAAAVAVTAFTL